MKINFDNDINSRISSQNSSSGQVNAYGSTDTSKLKKNGLGAGMIDGASFTKTFGNAEQSSYTYAGKNSTEDMKNAAQATDVDMKRDYMSVMSLSMSDEDYAEMVRTGEVPEDMDVTDTVTIMDDIKTALIRGGTQVVGYTDDIDKEALEEIAGSVTAAGQLISSMQEQDVPVNDDTVSAAAKAVSMAEESLPLTDSAVKYLIENDKAPTIMNVNQAAHAGNTLKTVSADSTDIQAIQQQMEDTIRKAGLEVNDKTMSEASWLVEQGIGLTAKNINTLESLEGLRVDVDTGSITDAVSIAMSAGIEPRNANLTYTDSIYLQAEDYIERINNISEETADAAAQEGIELTLSNLETLQSGQISADMTVSQKTPEMLHARRVLEEARLNMTVEANRALIRSNFQIDITPMEELIDALKEAEDSFESSLFPDEDAAVSAEKTDIYRSVKAELPQIPSMPAAIVAELDENGELKYNADGSFDLHSVYESGVSRREAYRQAGETYEALMTSPRADLGDSITKAFANVDDILEDMNMDTDDDNRRAVRILGYNSMEITPENVEQVRDADVNLRNTLSRLTPGRVITMIRDDVNPMNMTVSELNDYLDSQGEDPQKQAANYARFLMQLEKQDEISDLEKDSYIGIYRMLNSLETTDDRALGAVMDMGMQTTFANLLSSMRTAAKGKVDYTIDDSFGGVDSLQKTPAIDEQIEAAFSTKSIAESGNVTDTDIENLLQMGEPVSLSNLDALELLKSKRGDWFRTVVSESDDGEETVSAIEDALEGMTDAGSAQSSYVNMLQSFMNSLSDRVYEKDSYLDVRALQSSMRQLSLLTGRADEEEYDFPAMIDGEATSIRLVFKHEDGAGRLMVSMETESLGKIAAEFDYSGEASGYIAYDRQDASEKIADLAAGLGEELGFAPETVYASDLNLDRYVQTDAGAAGKKADGDVNEAESGADINSTELYRIAKSFISAVNKI